MRGLSTLPSHHTWQADLWDAFPQFSENVGQTIGWLQRYARLSTGLHKLNKDYGKGLAKLVKKEAAGSEEGSSLAVSHKSCLAQLTLLAGKHKQIAVSLGGLAREYETHTARLRDQHKAVEVEGRRLQHDMDNNIKMLFKSHEKFDRRQMESHLAEDNLSKSEPDSRISRAELDKMREAADEAGLRASRAREEYSLQLSLTNKHQRAFYQEAWPALYSRLRLVGREAEEGVADLLARLVAAGRDQWPQSEEAWGELDNCRDLLDFKGDFAGFVILSKSGNPVPSEFPFREPTKREVFSSPRTPFGSLRRSISRTSVRYRSPSLLRSSLFPSMFSLRGETTKLGRKSFRREKSNGGGNKSLESIDKIAEDDESVNTRNSPVNENPVDVPMTSSASPKQLRQINNPFLNGGGEAEPFTNGDGDNHFEESVGTAVSRGILEEVINNIGLNTASTTEEETEYDDRKNPFMEEFYDESLSAA